MKKEIFSILMAAVLFFGIGSQGVNAEWRQNTDSTNNWYYYENGTVKCGWLLDNNKWYFLDIYGKMQVGWISDNGTWYYLSNDGTLDNSKTIHSQPEELASGRAKVEQYANETVSYYETQNYEGQSAYIYLPLEQIKYGTPSYYYIPSTGKVFEITEGIAVRLDVNQLINAKYTFDQCKNIADEAFKGESNGSYSISSDGKVNKWGEYYFTAYSTTSNEKLDAFYVSGYNGQLRR